jgi:hypothetical protein
MEKSIIVSIDTIRAIDPKHRVETKGAAVEALNQLLNDGWSVKQSYPMGSGSHYAAMSLVILQKE